MEKRGRGRCSRLLRLYSYLVEELNTNKRQGNRIPHFASAVHSRHPQRRRNDSFCCLKLFAVNACTASGEENPQNWPFPLRFRDPAGRGPSHGQATRTKKLVKIARVVPEICSRTDRQTRRQTDVFIALLRHRCRGQIKIC